MRSDLFIQFVGNPRQTAKHRFMVLTCKRQFIRGIYQIFVLPSDSQRTPASGWSSLEIYFLFIFIYLFILFGFFFNCLVFLQAILSNFTIMCANNDAGGYLLINYPQII